MRIANAGTFNNIPDINRNLGLMDFQTHLTIRQLRLLKVLGKELNLRRAAGGVELLAARGVAQPDGD